MKYDKNVWKKILVARIQEYVHMKSQPKNEKYANGSVGARLIIIILYSLKTLKIIKSTL